MHVWAILCMQCTCDYNIREGTPHQNLTVYKDKSLESNCIVEPVVDRIQILWTLKESLIYKDRENVFNVLNIYVYNVYSKVKLNASIILLVCLIHFLINIMWILKGKSGGCL